MISKKGMENEKIIAITISVSLIIFSIVAFFIWGLLIGGVALIASIIFTLVSTGLWSWLTEQPWFPFVFLFLVMIVVITVIIWFITKGGAQVTAGAEYSAEIGLKSIYQSMAFKQLRQFIENPFGIKPQAAEVEEIPDEALSGKTAPNQAFSVEISKMTDMVQFDYKALAFVITIKNEGSTRIPQMEVKIKSEFPSKGCIRFDKSGFNNEECNLVGNNQLVCLINNIGPYAQKNVVISGVSISSSCVAEEIGDIKPEVPTPVYINVYASTYYPTTSRLAIERIKSDYGVMLFQNNMLLPQPTRAITRAGSAVTLNLDVGDQPILDTVKKGGLIMNWINTGMGELDNSKYPFLFIITPGNMGACNIQGVSGKIYRIIYEDSLTEEDCKNEAKSEAISCSRQYVSRFKQECGLGVCGENNIDEKCYNNLESKYTSYEFYSDTWADFGLKLKEEIEKCDRCDKTSESYKKCIERITYLESNSAKECYEKATGVFYNCKEAILLFGSADNKGPCNSINFNEDDFKCLICDNALVKTWCREGNPINSQIKSYAPSIVKTFEWICKKAKENVGWKNEQYHICATNAMTKEFDVFTCGLELCSERDVDETGKFPVLMTDGSTCKSWEIKTNENRVTQYVTALALYPYKASVVTQVNAYCTVGNC